MKENNMLFKSKVCFDDYYEKNQDPNLIYDCWLDATSKGWNGWAMPYLEESEFNKFMENMKIDFNNMEDDYDKDFLEELSLIKPEVINGKTMYYFGGWLTWNIEDDDFIEKRDNLLSRTKPCNSVKELKEFRLVKVSTITEECYVMADDWEKAEELGHLSEDLDWRMMNSEAEIEVDFEESE
tara:strand:+ start:822 stop:1367 length:546 start_codon:yes stop_codon:yes gene_type:complete